MTTTPESAKQANKVVVACLDGRRVKGFVYNFSAVRDSFTVFHFDDSHQKSAVEIGMKEAKAVFFVKDFTGNREYQDISRPDLPKHGRKIEVTFADGEKLIGSTEAYNPAKLGFFMFPIDPKSNNARIFVIRENVVQTRFL